MRMEVSFFDTYLVSSVSQDFIPKQLTNSYVFMNFYFSQSKSELKGVSQNNSGNFSVILTWG